MKKIETTETITKVNVHYEALDGTYFCDEEECKKYDQSAACVIRAKFNELALVKSNGYTLFPGGNDDNAAYVVKPETDHDIDTVRQFQAMIGLKYDKNYTPTITKDDKGKMLVIVTGYDDDWIDVRRMDDILAGLTPKSDKAE